ncbi:alkaline phosphatase D family protein [Adhaeribacter radiodurans]|uniref:Alkaline phosphatase family protein n=1 Tax=Adhaeribacter radiodurans TaxID=2745197 RepID=A0A7L7L444_9BACT|nr:alkaline phosphatase D family protein [Adhaeribacter radiodurans]QMU27543.1 alkaline phosphatase family protein [Adhaeribacter radiodurans]
MSFRVLYNLVLLFCIFGIRNLNAQTTILQAGPMVGYADLKEVMLWVQTRTEAEVKIMYWDKTIPKTKYSTAPVKTSKSQAFAAHLLADQVQPGRKYGYELYINNKKVSRPYPLQFQTQELWQFRKDAPNFRFVIGSCNYINEPEADRPGNPSGGDYQIFSSILAQKPDFMLWLGDNTYLREPDWNTRTGILHRYTHTRSVPEMQPLLGAVPQYAIWDDHDYGPNDADRSFWNKDITTEALKLFWANPNYNLTGEGGITGTFNWNDAQFFLLDDRYFRSPNNSKRDKVLLGKTQLNWLIDALTSSKASFKFICIGGQVLNSVNAFENYSTFPIEKQQLLNRITAARIPGVIFLDGDRHHTELSRLNRKGTYPLYDLTISPLTAGPGKGDGNANKNQLPGTFYNQRNFAVLAVSGPDTDRVLIITVYSYDSEPIWQQQIRANDLK